MATIKPTLTAPVGSLSELTNATPAPLTPKTAHPRTTTKPGHPSLTREAAQPRATTNRAPTSAPTRMPTQRRRRADAIDYSTRPVQRLSSIARRAGWSSTSSSGLHPGQPNSATTPDSRASDSRATRTPQSDGPAATSTPPPFGSAGSTPTPTPASSPTPTANAATSP